MTPEKQRIKIAEVCGWEFHTSVDVNFKAQPEFWTDPDGGIHYDDTPFPDYPNDLNAMHEAEKRLTPEQCFEYNELLSKICVRPHLFKKPAKPEYFMFNSTSQQRAEAFLRTLNLWEEE